MSDHCGDMRNYQKKTTTAVIGLRSIREVTIEALHNIVGMQS